MPGGMRAVARLNPMTYAIDALRALILTGWQAGPLPRITTILLAVRRALPGRGGPSPALARL
jgi:ABC-2 type transport system permease protein